jgi:saposin
MLKLAVFVALVSVAAAASPLGADPCTNGPSFWCDSMENAQRCGSVQFCQAKGLLNENAPLSVPKATPAKLSPQANGVECEVCTFAIKAIDSYLSENSTETEIIGYLNDLCSKLGSEASLCKIFVASYGDQLVQYIIGLLSVTDVCNDFLHVCSASAYTFVHRRASALIKAAPNDDCAVCKEVVGALDSALEDNSTVTAIVSEIEKVCSDLGPLEGVCKDFVDKEAPRVIDYLVGELNPDTVCKDIGLCSSAAALSQTQINKLGGESCTYGPSYWCKSKETAAACQQTEFCLRVWAKSSP